MVKSIIYQEITYDESKNAEETKEDAKQFGKAKNQSYIYVNKK